VTILPLLKKKNQIGKSKKPKRTKKEKGNSSTPKEKPHPPIRTLLVRSTVAASAFSNHHRQSRWPQSWLSPTKQPTR